MKRLFASAVILFFALSAVAHDKHDHDKDQDEHGRKSMKFTQDGAFASASASIGPGASFNVNISRGSSSTSPASTFINFTSFQLSDDNNSETFTSIFGEIPNSAFTGNNTKSLVLNLDTSTLDPSLTSSETCTVDLNQLTVVCTTAPLGVIHLEFQENGIQATKILNHVEEDIVGPVTTLIHSSSDSGSANVQGSLFGVPVSSSAATVGVNHSSSIEITRH
ncbi:MAG TPA: hypothetical protein VIB39_05110 [Candidatus Angelobacter sp.]|jgi:hypothetical protein